MVSLEYEMKLEKFEHDIKDEKKLNKKLKILFENEYDEILGDILNLKDELFIDQVKEGVSLLLEDHYTDSCLSDDRLTKLLEDNINEIKSKYRYDYALINKAWTNYNKISKRRSNNESFLSGFRKHCIYTDERASHNCCSNEKDGERNCRFIIVNNSDSKKGIKFVVCENCKKVYYSSFILARCYKCNVDYYTSLLSKNENPDLLLATWENYHCPQFINEKMKCIKCHDFFYVNMKTGLLTCLNKKCEFVSKPQRILWTCSVCKEEFICGAIPYNPLDAEVTRRLVTQTILLKHKAHPNKMPCCKLNVFFTDFHHKQNCNGLLYESELDDNAIIVCEKCKSINYYDRFVWTCPKCGKKFKDSIVPSSNENSETTANSYKERKSDKKEKEKEKEREREKERDIEEKDMKKINTERKNMRKEKEILENKKISTPKPMQYLSKRLGHKKEHELKEFKLNDNDNIIEEDEQNEKKREENVKKIDTTRKFRRFHFNSININQNDKDKNDEKNKKEENNNIEEEPNEHNYKKNRSGSMHNVEKKEEQKRSYRRFRHERDNKDREIKDEKQKVEEKEKEDEKEKTEEKQQETLSPRIQWRKRYKRNIEPLKKDSCDEKNKDLEKEEREKKELEERERKEKEEKERKEKEEKERKEKEERERREKEEKERKEKEKNREIYVSNRGWFRHLGSMGKDKEEKEKEKEKENKRESTSKTSKKEKEENEENEDNEESDEDNKSIDNNDEDDTNDIINFKNDSDEEEDEDEAENAKEEKENPMEPDSLLINYKFQRNQNKKKTKGMELVGDQEDNENEEKYIIKKRTSVPQIKIAMSKIPGISEHLFNHIKKRMTTILNRCKIPIFNIEDYTFNKKLGEGSYAVIFSVYKNDDKEKKKLALKKIIAKTLTEIDKFTKEFELVHSCDHPNIMKIYGICIRMLDQTTYSLYVLMELSHCDWDKEIKIHLMKKKSYTENELINILRQLAGALSFMQQNLKISHRDIKPQNVLLFGNGLYKIADFGEAKEAKLSKQVNTLRGTELYMSPALYSGLKNDRNDVNHDPYKSDVFSLGFCFLYASTLNFNILYQVREIYNSNKMKDIIHQQLNKKYSQTFISILSHMMETDESERFDFPHLVEFIDENYDKDGNLKNPEKVEEKKHEFSHRGINRKHK